MDIKILQCRNLYKLRLHKQTGGTHTYNHNSTMDWEKTRETVLRVMRK